MAMRSPHPLRNGETPLQSPNHRDHRFPSPNPQFRSTVTEQKLRRFNSLVFVLRLTSFSFSVASSVFMLTNTRGGGDGGAAASSDSPHWYDFDTFRLVFAANGIVALYSLFELGATVWEISRNLTVLPEVLQVWFDFGHDQSWRVKDPVYPGVCISVAVSVLSGGIIGKDNEKNGHVYGQQCILLAGRYLYFAGFCCISILRAHFIAIGFSGRMFHN